MEGCNPTVTPGVKESRANLEKDKPTDWSRVTTFRAAAARCNYLSADRPDCQFASKEVCRLMILLDMKSTKLSAEWFTVYSLFI